MSHLLAAVSSDAFRLFRGIVLSDSEMGGITRVFVASDGELLLAAWLNSSGRRKEALIFALFPEEF
jgi:hypothetical protein